MKTTILVYRKRTQVLEVRAAEKVEQYFKNPWDIQQKVKETIAHFLEAIREESQEAELQGLKFGSHIRDLAIPKGSKTKPSNHTQKQIIRIDDEKLIFAMHLEREIQDYHASLAIEIKKMEQRGMGKDALYRYIRGNAFLIEWKGKKNAIRKRTANFINACSNAGYYSGLAGKTWKK